MLVCMCVYVCIGEHMTLVEENLCSYAVGDGFL